MSETEKKSRKFSLYIIGLVLFIWLYSLWADRVTPITTAANVHSYLVGISPEVTGNLVEVNIKNNQRVAMGEEMFKIDPRVYQLNLRTAQANLKIAGQSIGANTAAVNVAQAKQVEATAAYNNANEQSKRTIKLAERGIVSQSTLDNTIESRDRASASLKAADASLIQAKQNLGPVGESNPQLLHALVELEKAQLDLQRTVVKAPSDGIVTNLQLTVGQRANVGVSMLTFIDPRDVWVTAMVRENSLEYIQPGNTVKIVLDALPGRVLNGTVSNIGWGIGGTNNIDSSTGFLNANTQSSAQRYPVNIIFKDYDVPNNIRFGSQATIAILTNESGLGDWLANIWIHIVSVWTYVS